MRRRSVGPDEAVGWVLAEAHFPGRRPPHPHHRPVVRGRDIDHRLILADPVMHPVGVGHRDLAATKYPRDDGNMATRQSVRALEHLERRRRDLLWRQQYLGDRSGARADLPGDLWQRRAWHWADPASPLPRVDPSVLPQNGVRWGAILLGRRFFRGADDRAALPSCRVQQLSQRHCHGNRPGQLGQRPTRSEA
jgi:hypothetical protein